MNKRTVKFQTLGCRYNRYESAEMAHTLESAGYRAVPPSQAADVVIVNTCTVTAKSDARCRAAIRSAKADNPDATLVVTGCYAETSPEKVACVEGVDLVAGAGEKFSIPELLRDIDGGDGVRTMMDKPLPDLLPVHPVKAMEGRTNAYLNVQSGCDEVCTFCIVRFARGRSRSADPGQLVEQVNRLANAGIHEVVLSGINIGQYRSVDGMGLAGLIQKILDSTDIQRIRISSVNPNDVTDGLIDLMAKSPRVCRHLHIPLQSGSDIVLERMRRPYTSAEYFRLLDRLAARIPDIGLGADVMVGFPGETDREFEMTYQLLEKSPLMMLHVFAYSPREGTDACNMDDAPPKQVAKERSAKLKKLSARLGMAFRQRFIGSALDVLIENSRDKEGKLKGFSGNYIPVGLDGPDGWMNKVVSVKITGGDKERLTGTFANKEQ